MDEAWQRGLNVLNASQREVERGCRLHQELEVCDTYGFLPRTPASRLPDTLEEIGSSGKGLLCAKRKSWQTRITASTWDDEARGEFLAALDRANLCGMVQPVNDIGEAMEDAIELIAAHRHLCHEFSSRIFQATTAEDLIAARKNNRTGIIFSLTGLPVFGAGSMADPDGIFDWIDTWYLLGVRFMHVGYNRRNYFADGCMEETDGGLSDLGRELVSRLNRSGILVDLPHSSPKTTFDAVAQSSRPVVATHAGCREIHDHPRCKSDRELKAIADTDGLVGIFALPEFLGPEADLNLLLQHIAHAVELLGARHVSIGTDLSYGRPVAETLRTQPQFAAFLRKASGFKPEHVQHESHEHRGGSLTWTNWPLFTVGLLRLGLSETDIAQILGGNLRRILSAARPQHAS